MQRLAVLLTFVNYEPSFSPTDLFPDHDHKYYGSVFAPNVGKIFSAPWTGSRGVLITDPVSLAFDHTAIRPVGGTHFYARGSLYGNWANFAFANSTGKIYGAPSFHDFVLTVDPMTNDSNCDQIGPFRGEFQYETAIYVGGALDVVVFIPFRATTGIMTLTVATNTTTFASKTTVKC